MRMNEELSNQERMNLLGMLFGVSDLSFLLELERLHPEDKMIQRAIYLNDDCGVGWENCEDLSLEVEYNETLDKLMYKYGLLSGNTSFKDT